MQRPVAARTVLETLAELEGPEDSGMAFVNFKLVAPSTAPITDRSGQEPHETRGRQVHSVINNMVPSQCFQGTAE